ncbi:hypothetical protein B7494_g106 [Chlorociboria aeruginascens]|nr:hypothetical protein B7494_g106 [Chlorociboria aeruginascens]
MTSKIGQRLEGKTIVVTGASSGIGRSTAIEFARTSPKNLRLILTARRIEVLEEIREEIRKEVGEGVKVLPVKLDVSEPKQVAAFVPGLPEEWRDIDVGLAKGFAKTPDIGKEDIAAMFDTNVMGLINMTQAVFPIFKKRPEGGKGDIINIGSIAGREPYAGGSVYCASKAAVRAFTDALRKETIDSRIRIMNLDPGMVETEFSTVRFNGDKTKAGAVYTGCEPLTPDDIAEVIVFAVGRRENVVIADTLVYPSHQGCFIRSPNLDSLCCAVVLAYLRTYAITSKSNTFYIPLSNIPSTDLTLRPELLKILSHANLVPSDLITLSDLPPISQKPFKLLPENTKWILVDHNALQGELGKLFGKRLTGCIDHHEEEHKVPAECVDEPRIVQKSGSCSSLVVEYCKRAWDALALKSEPNNGEAASWAADLARLALGPVLIDTNNLTSKSKTTPVDISATEYLEKWIRAKAGQNYNREEYFNEISNAKEDIGHLSLSGILRKDYKQWTGANESINLGVSSVVKDMQFLIDKAGGKEEFFNTLKEFAEKRGLEICSIMTTSHPDGKFRRELLVWVMNEKGLEAARKFEKDSMDKLELKKWGEGGLDLDGEKQWRRCWWQNRLDNSRKQVAPLMTAAMA